MSLAIDVDEVSAVLIAGKWHLVAKSSFDLDSFEFMHKGVLVHGGGNSGVCATGFTFIDNHGVEVCGPLTAIQAVTMKRRKR